MIIGGLHGLEHSLYILVGQGSIYLVWKFRALHKGSWGGALDSDVLMAVLSRAYFLWPTCVEAAFEIS